MKMLLRKMAACCGSGAPAALGARRLSRPRRSLDRSAGSLSRGSSSGHSGGSSRGRGADTPVKGTSEVLVRLTSGLRSWLKGIRAAPEGYFSADVGKEKIRYIIPIAYLSHENLQTLLDESAAEFGYSHSGVLQLACEEDELLKMLDTIHCCYKGEQDLEDAKHRLVAAAT